MRRHGVDAAVMFADIMTPVVAMGVDVKLVEGVGPVVESVRRRSSCTSPTRSRRRCARRSGSCAASSTTTKAVVGFCGAPFTVAGYLIEGKPSRDFAKVKAFMYREPRAWHALMDDARGLLRALRARAGRTRAPT